MSLEALIGLLPIFLGLAIHGELAAGLQRRHTGLLLWPRPGTGRQYPGNWLARLRDFGQSFLEINGSGNAYYYFINTDGWRGVRPGSRSTRGRCGWLSCLAATTGCSAAATNADAARTRWHCTCSSTPIRPGRASCASPPSCVCWGAGAAGLHSNRAYHRLGGGRRRPTCSMPGPIGTACLRSWPGLPRGQGSGVRGQGLKCLRLQNCRGQHSGGPAGVPSLTPGP